MYSVPFPQCRITTRQQHPFAPMSAGLTAGGAAAAAGGGGNSMASKKEAAKALLKTGWLKTRSVLTNKSKIELLVEDSTNLEPWGPTGQQMNGAASGRVGARLLAPPAGEAESQRVAQGEQADVILIFAISWSAGHDLRVTRVCSMPGPPTNHRPWLLPNLTLFCRDCGGLL